MIESQGVSFSWKRWCCAIYAKLDTCLVRIVLITTPTQKNSGMSLIEQGDTSHQANQISVQPEPPAVIHPNSGSQLDTPTLTEETDKGSSLRKSLVWILAQGHTQIHTLALIPGRNLLLSLIFLRGNLPSCLSKITCLRVERIRLLQKKTSLKEAESNLPLKKKQITKKKNISKYFYLSNAESEKEKQIKNDQKRTSSREPNLN